MEQEMEKVTGNVHAASGTGDFSTFLAEVQATFRRNVELHGNAIYRTHIGPQQNSPFNAIYLDGFEDQGDTRQHHNCSCCRHWLRQFGDLVFIDKTGRAVSAFWDPLMISDKTYLNSVIGLKEKAENSPVLSAWVNTEETIGVEEAGGFNHFYLLVPDMFHKRVGKVSSANVGRAVSDLNDDYEVLKRSIAQYDIPTVELAASLTNSTGVFENSAGLGERANFFLEVLRTVEGIKHNLHRDNYIRMRATTTPVGWARPTSTVLGTLLDDLKAGTNANVALKRLNQLLDPIRYRRTEEEAVRKGQVDRAEKILKDLGINEKLQFAFARLTDIPTKLWEPKVEEVVVKADNESMSSMFDDLRGDVAKKDENKTVVAVEGGRITMSKFLEKVLPRAVSMKIYMGRGNMNMRHYFKMLNESIPAIWAHDLVEDDRLPISSFVYQNGCHPRVVGLDSDTWVDVTAIIPHQYRMKGNRVHNSVEAYTFVLKGAIDTAGPTVPLFPSELRRELKEVDNVIEAIGKRLFIQDSDKAEVIGVDFMNNGSETPFRVMVSDGVTSTQYIVDRFS